MAGTIGRRKFLATLGGAPASIGGLRALGRDARLTQSGGRSPFVVRGRAALGAVRMDGQARFEREQKFGVADTSSGTLGRGRRPVFFGFRCDYADAKGSSVERQENYETTSGNMLASRYSDRPPRGRVFAGKLTACAQRNDSQSSTKLTAMAGAALATYIDGLRQSRKAPVGARATAPKQVVPGSSAIVKAGWRKILARVARDISRKHLTYLAAGAAFNAFLAIPAALAVYVSLSLLIFDPLIVQGVLGPVVPLVPSYVLRLLSAPHSRSTLEIGLLVSLAIDLWSILSGSSCMLTALRLAEGEESKSSFIARQVAVLALAAIMVPFMLVSLLLILALPSVLDLVSLSPLAKTSIFVIRWPLLVALFMTVSAAAYRYAPHHAEQRWRWMSWGVAVATVLWISGSALFATFATKFLPYDPTYGAIGSIIALLIWLNFTALVALLGAQIDAEIKRERHTGQTKGQPGAFP